MVRVRIRVLNLNLKFVFISSPSKVLVQKGDLVENFIRVAHNQKLMHRFKVMLIIIDWVVWSVMLVRVRVRLA